MTTTPIPHALRRWLLLVALFCALLARAAVPAGWMPVTTADGTIGLAPCTGMGAMDMAGDMVGAAMPGMAMPATHTQPSSHDHHQPMQKDDHPCIGAGLAVALDAPGVNLIAAIVLAVQPAASHPLTAMVGQGLAAPPPPQTGPPAFV